MNLELQFADYASHHAHSINRLCHYIGLPLIALCLFGLGAKVRLVELGGRLPLDLGVLLALVLVAVYFTWHPRSAVGIALAFVPLYVVGARLPAAALILLLGVGVAFQYVGHYIFEKRSPAFHHNLLHTLIGPLWIAESLFHVLARLTRSRG